MDSNALIPANLENKFVSCPVSTKNENAEYFSSTDVNYQLKGWEDKVSHDWKFFDSSKEDGKVIVIDFNQTKNGLEYRYVANDETHDELFEPWSSSKVMAISAAMANARKLGLDNPSRVGDIHISDLITSVHAYSDFGKSKSSSNSIATYFVDMVGRDELTSYFHKGWLRLANPEIKFRGGYGEKPFIPSSKYWHSESIDESVVVEGYDQNNIDPGGLSYRCESCGLTGNKSMTTLASAEWLKRLASHERDQLTRHPYLEIADIEKLFYGTGHSDNDATIGGMSRGISQLLPLALANAMNQQTVSNPKAILDDATNGQWRVWQKIGWGPSETRNAGEYVMLAHVCLPKFQGGREFTLSAQVAIPGAGENDSEAVGRKMQALLNRSIKKLLGIRAN
ncbi:MAG: hypothetical protein KUG78_15390 [Kangiellaceae bacterium]|nr:hypothetical protein [Kangiellaceae bacterium]